jgi:hypothetical protein
MVRPSRPWPRSTGRGRPGAGRERPAIRRACIGVSPRAWTNFISPEGFSQSTVKGPPHPPRVVRWSQGTGAAIDHTGGSRPDPGIRPDFGARRPGDPAREQRWNKRRTRGHLTDHSSGGGRDPQRAEESVRLIARPRREVKRVRVAGGDAVTELQGPQT